MLVELNARLKRKSTTIILQISQFSITKMVILKEKYQQKHHFDELQFSISSKNTNEQSVEEIYLDVLVEGKQQIDLFSGKWSSTDENQHQQWRSEIENQLRISLHVDRIRNRAHEGRLFGQVARQKQD